MKIDRTILTLACAVSITLTGDYVLAQGLPPTQDWFAICTNLETWGGFEESTNSALFSNLTNGMFGAILPMRGYWSTNTPSPSDFTNWQAYMLPSPPSAPTGGVRITGLLGPGGEIPAVWQVYDNQVNTTNISGVVTCPGFFWTNGFDIQYWQMLRVTYPESVRAYTNSLWYPFIITAWTNNNGVFSTNSNYAVMLPGIQIQSYRIVPSKASYWNALSEGMNGLSKKGYEHNSLVLGTCTTSTNSPDSVGSGGPYTITTIGGQPVVISNPDSGGTNSQSQNCFDTNSPSDSNTNPIDPVLYPIIFPDPPGQINGSDYNYNVRTLSRTDGPLFPTGSSSPAVTLHGRGIPNGATYGVQWVPLLGSASWETITNATTAPDGTWSATFPPPASTNGCAFFRIEQTGP